MLPKKNRLPARMIPLLAYKGEKLAGKHLEVRFAPDERLEHPLFAITVTTKVSKSAVVRNRIRRQLKVMVEELATKPKLRKGRYLILARTVLSEPDRDLSQELSSIILK